MMLISGAIDVVHYKEIRDFPLFAGLGYDYVL